MISSFTQDFRTADGGIRSMDVAYTWIQANVTCPRRLYHFLC